MLFAFWKRSEAIKKQRDSDVLLFFIVTFYQHLGEHIPPLSHREGERAYNASEGIPSQLIFRFSGKGIMLCSTICFSAGP